MTFEKSLRCSGIEINNHSGFPLYTICSTKCRGTCKQLLILPIIHPKKPTVHSGKNLPSLVSSKCCCWHQKTCRKAERKSLGHVAVIPGKYIRSILGLYKKRTFSHYHNMAGRRTRTLCPRQRILSAGKEHSALTS